MYSSVHGWSVTGTGNVLKVQALLHACSEHYDVKDQDNNDKKDTDKKDADEPDTAMKGSASVPSSSFRRAKGTVFLVDSHNRRVLWSVYDQPKNSSASEMDRTAGRIASRLKREITGK